jgi:micrococcal nuclease
LACINAPDIAKRQRFRASRTSSTSYDNSAFERFADNLRSLVSGRLVGIRRITTDRYGCTVTELFIDDKNVGQQQVLNGFAVIFQEDAGQCAWSSRS